jgi:hypothetical protein
MRITALGALPTTTAIPTGVVPPPAPIPSSFTTALTTTAQTSSGGGFWDFMRGTGNRILDIFTQGAPVPPPPVGVPVPPPAPSIITARNVLLLGITVGGVLLVMMLLRPKRGGA